MANPADLLNMTQAVEIAGQNRNTIAEAAKRGEIRGAVRKGTRWNAPYRFDPDGLQEWIEAQYVPAAADSEQVAAS